MTSDERAQARGWRIIETPPAPRVLRPAGSIDVAEAEPIGRRSRWLNEILVDSEKSARLSAWERNFTEGLRRRFERHGTETLVSIAQMTTLRRIEEKIYAAG